MASIVSEAARVHGGARRRLPEAVPRWVRHRAWRAVDFVALDVQATEADPRGDAVVSFAAVPVRAGRVDLREARCGKVTPDRPSSQGSVGIAPGLKERVDDLDQTLEPLRVALDRRYLITWSAEVEAPFLDQMFGGGRIRWLRRTIDVHRLVSIADRLQGRGPRPEDYGLDALAGEFRLPVPQPCDPMDAALTTAQLFLILATKLAGLGHRDVGSLLWRPRAR